MADLICDDGWMNPGCVSKIYLSPDKEGAVLELWEYESDCKTATHIYLNQEALNKLIWALQQYVKR